MTMIHRPKSPPEAPKPRIVRGGGLRPFDPSHLEDFGSSEAASASESSESAKTPPSHPLEPESEQTSPPEAWLEELEALKKQVLDEATREADALIAQARKRAIKMLEDTKQECDQLRQQAFEEGRNAGIQQGFQNAQEELQKRLQQLQQFVEQWQAQFAATEEERARQLERQALALSLAVAKKVVEREIATHPDAVLSLVQRGLQMLQDAQQVTLWVSADDMAFLREHRPQILERFETLEQVHIQVREQLRPGECLLETETQMVDATLAERFRRAEEILSQMEIELTGTSHAKPLEGAIAAVEAATNEE